MKVPYGFIAVPFPLQEGAQGNAIGFVEVNDGAKLREWKEAADRYLTILEEVPQYTTGITLATAHGKNVLMPPTIRRFLQQQ